MAKRLTRKESAALTRAKLFEAAQMLFAQRGYLAASVDAIVDQAGLTKGAFYAQFSGKAEIFLFVFRDRASEAMEDFVARLDTAASKAEVVELLCEWARACSTSGLWPLAILEFTHSGTATPEHVAQLRAALESHWKMLGEVVARRLDHEADPLLLGAMLHELAFAPAMTIVEKPQAVDLMRLFLKSRGL